MPREHGYGEMTVVTDREIPGVAQGYDQRSSWIDSDSDTEGECCCCRGWDCISMETGATEETDARREACGLADRRSDL